MVADKTILEAEGVSPLADRGTVTGYPVLQARDLWFAYDSARPVLKDVSLDVRAGSMTMILGRSGGGKTTLLRVLKGLLRPQRGTVTLTAAGANGRPAAGAIAYVPQTLGLVRSSSALDNALTGALSRVGLLGSLVRVFPGDIVSEAKETIARLGLEHKIHEPVWALSGGERQRIAIARALMQHPALILADEFVSQLDPITAEEILGMMRNIARTQGVALLITTHETDVVDEYADRIVVMVDGQVRHDVPGGRLSQHEMLQLLR
jgi:phosphonate transport system ATP-binding protein